jgi:hypothetical protein
MENNANFPEGMRISPRRENAPDFIKGHISIRVDEFTSWLHANQKSDGWVNIDIKKSKKGNLYLQLNTYQKDKSVLSDEIPIIEDSY